MSTAQHTPGPWSVSKRPTAKDGIEHAGGFVAFVAIPRTVSDERLDGESWLDMRQRTEGARIAVMAEQEANARVITTAPEMLALIKDEYACLADIHHNWPGRDTIAGQRRLSRLRDLICKATGREPQDVQDDYTNRSTEAAA